MKLPRLEVCDQGYKGLGYLGCHGGISKSKEQAVVQRTAKAGATTMSVMMLTDNLAGDFREGKAQQVIGIRTRWPKLKEQGIKFSAGPLIGPTKQGHARNCEFALGLNQQDR